MRTGDGPLRQRILSRGCILPSKLWLTCVSFDDVIQYRQTITSRVGSSTHGSKGGMRHCYKSMGRMWLGGKRFKHRQAQHPTPKARSSKCGKVTKRWHQQWYGHLFLETRERTLRSSGASPPTAPPPSYDGVTEHYSNVPSRWHLMLTCKIPTMPLTSKAAGFQSLVSSNWYLNNGGDWSKYYTGK